ncbi:hypothetical protein H6P81_017191 [Aristolochia fimbriata]|uniref:Uncharacterized protein n=1 Tax=Aristolochia fimbriata TaxID=158543 RepID=A0AAV7DXN4_ARIFI|nr:hypothetical protein H6P81_017191 [Aristolochia fimbriata]
MKKVFTISSETEVDWGPNNVHLAFIFNLIKKSSNNEQLQNSSEIQFHENRRSNLNTHFLSLLKIMKLSAYQELREGDDSEEAEGEQVRVEVAVTLHLSCGWRAAMFKRRPYSLDCCWYAKY